MSQGGAAIGPFRTESCVPPTSKGGDAYRERKQTGKYPFARRLQRPKRRQKNVRKQDFEHGKEKKNGEMCRQCEEEESGGKRHHHIDAHHTVVYGGGKNAHDNRAEQKEQHICRKSEKSPRLPKVPACLFLTAKPRKGHARAYGLCFLLHLLRGGDHPAQNSTRPKECADGKTVRRTEDALNHRRSSFRENARKDGGDRFAHRNKSAH